MCSFKLCPPPPPQVKKSFLRLELGQSFTVVTNIAELTYIHVCFVILEIHIFTFQINIPHRVQTLILYQHVNDM